VWSEEQWADKIAHHGIYCGPCAPPPDPREQRRRQFAAVGLSEAQAALALVQTYGDEAPPWAKDFHAATMARLAANTS